ncbi:MAG TPA: metallophosphoesterase [Bacillota bacterium]|nr:metallophosphoesterase [Bacillota bacterium]
MTKAKTQPIHLKIILERIGFTEVMQEIRGNLQKYLPIMGGAFLEIRLLHTADIHLDWLFERYNRNSREERRREVAARFRQIADIAIERSVHALLLAGDIFHGEAIAESTFQFFRLQIERLSQQGIWTLIVPGNHDPLVEGSYWTRRIFPEHAKVFTGTEWECFSEIPGLEIWGLPFIPENCRKRVVADLPKATTETHRKIAPSARRLL